jgi:hypothetical protein
MRIADALRRAVQEHPERLQVHKRDKRSRAAALRIEEHAYGRASNVKPKKGAN